MRLSIIVSTTVSTTVSILAVAGMGESQASGQQNDDEAPSAIYGFDGDDETETLPPASPTGGDVTHTVRKGDTLWDISQARFHDPWRWPKVWALNPEITNPHWIFPGQTIRLQASAVAGPDATSEHPAPTTGTAGSLRPRVATVGSDTENLRQIGFIDEGSFKAAGVINGSLEEKLLLATGDHAYVEFPADRPPKGGTRYTVYQADAGHPITEPGSKSVLGYLVHVYGEVVIDSLTDRPIANARLVDLAEPVERGYRVGPFIHQLKTVKPKHNEADVTAHIIVSVEPNMLIANQMFVVLDRGRRHGVDVGNRFLVLRHGDGLKRVMEDWDAADHRFPPHAVAEIVAVDVQEGTTIGWISRATRELHTGDIADLRRGY